MTPAEANLKLAQMKTELVSEDEQRTNNAAVGAAATTTCNTLWLWLPRDHDLLLGIVAGRVEIGAIIHTNIVFDLFSPALNLRVNKRWEPNNALSKSGFFRLFDLRRPHAFRTGACR